MTPGGTSGVPTAPTRRASSPRHSSSTLVGQDRAVAQVAGAAQVVVDRVELDAGGADDLEGLGRDLGADAVAADDSDLVAHCVSVKVSGGSGSGAPVPAGNRPEK